MQQKRIKEAIRELLQTYKCIKVQTQQVSDLICGGCAAEMLMTVQCDLLFVCCVSESALPVMCQSSMLSMWGGYIRNAAFFPPVPNLELQQNVLKAISCCSLKGTSAGNGFLSSVECCFWEAALKSTRGEQMWRIAVFKMMKKLLFTKNM